MKKVCLLLFLASVIGCSKTTPFERETSVDNAEITTKSGSLCDDVAKAQMKPVGIAEDNRPVQHSAPYWIDMTQEYCRTRVPIPETTTI